MKIGSPQHRKEYLQNLIKTYQENIWTDEINIFRYETEIAERNQEIKEIEKKLEAKEYKSANEGNKAKFVKEREIEHLKKAIAETEEKIKTWAERIVFIETIQKSESKKPDKQK
jgi:recombinational DNA repair ATPase RecF